MTNEIIQLVAEAKRIGLRPEENERVLRALRVFVAQNPMPSVRVSLAVRPPQWSDNLITALTRQIHFMPAIIIIALFAGGSVALAAEGSLPGDMLYPIKTRITENVLSVVALSDRSEADLEVRLAARRLEEAETLAAEGRLDEETRSTLQENFESHARNVEKRIKNLETKENFTAAVDVGSKFEASLRAHKRVIANADVSSSTRISLDSLTNTVLIRINATGDSRARSEVRVKSLSAIEREAKRSSSKATKEHESTTRYVENKKDQVSAEVYSDVIGRLEAAAVLIVEGNAKIETSAYKEAFSILQSALRSIQESKQLIEVEARVSRHEERNSGDEEEDANKEDEASSGSDSASSTNRNRDRKEREDSDSGSKAKVDVEVDIEADSSTKLHGDSVDDEYVLESSSDGEINVRIGL